MANVDELEYQLQKELKHDKDCFEYKFSYGDMNNTIRGRYYNVKSLIQHDTRDSISNSGKSTVFTISEQISMVKLLHTMMNFKYYHQNMNNLWEVGMVNIEELEY